MSNHHASLIVARDRGHVKQLLWHYPGYEVISASAFFDRLRVLAFLREKRLRRDDSALIPALVKHLVKNPHFNLQHLDQFLSLYAACYHGTKTPAEIYQAVKSQGFEFEPVFLLLKQVDEELEQAGLIQGVKALYYAWCSLQKNPQSPHGFSADRTIEMYYLVDLTLLEIEIIKSLSKSGVRFVLHFPFDGARRGINTVVDFIARQFENEADLLNVEIIFDEVTQDGPLGSLAQFALGDVATLEFDDDQVSLYKARDVGCEADSIAKKVAYLKTVSPRDRIAVSVRSLDTRSLVYKQAFKRYSIPYRDRKGKALYETKAGQLLRVLINAKITSMGRKEIIMLMNHSSFCYHVSDDMMRSKFLSLMDTLGIDDSVLIGIDSRARFKNLIEKMLSRINDDDRETILSLSQWLENCALLIERIPERDTLSGYAQIMLNIFDEAFIEDDTSKEVLREVLRKINESFIHSHGDEKIHNKDYFRVVASVVLKITVPVEENIDVNSVEILPMPELLGKKFDHVFIADMCFGKLPKNSIPDSLMNDSARMKLNSYFKIPVLRVYFEDPYEPSPTPPRQALEPLWFVAAITSAKKSIHFSYGERDEVGQEQAASDFFIWLLEHVRIRNQTIKDTGKFTDVIEQKFSVGIRDSSLPVANDFKQAYQARSRAFANKTPSSFAFQYDANNIKSIFDGRLDDDPHQSLTPSFIESFSRCQFKGLMDRIVGFRSDAVDADDIDPRIVGQIAHRVLEIFFKNKRILTTRDSLISLMKSMVHEVCQEFYRTHFIKNSMVFMCHEEWLVLVLVDLVQKMEAEPLYQDGLMIASEKAFGLNKNFAQALRLSANGRNYLLGGRIDRVDEYGHDLVVTDYKLSSIDVLKNELNAKNLMQKSFQMPIYVRLVAENMAKGEKISFIYASIRDGNIWAINSDKFPDLFDRIFDDDRVDGLAKTVDQIFSPIRQGIALPIIGEHCNACDLSFVCRKKEVDAYEP